MAIPSGSRLQSKSTSTCTESSRSLQSLRLSQHGKVSKFPLVESQELVDCNRARVVSSDVQERCFAAIPYPPHDLRHQDSSVALAGVIRMGADRAYFGVARHFQSLSRH